MSIRATVFAALWLIGASISTETSTVSAQEPGDSQPHPTRSDVAYGPHRRNVLDLYRAESDRPTPVLVYFHGGSFKAGDKGQFRHRVREYLDAGISVVSANYRFSADAPFPGPMLDGGRVVQFLRAHAADWKLDPGRIALSGGSAGGTLALWVALHDDLADPKSADPIARLSTRGCALHGFSAPTSLDPEVIRREIGPTNLGAAMLQVLGVESRDQLLTPAGKALTAEASPLNLASADDPPLMLTYGPDLVGTPFPAETPQNQWIHHPRFGQLLQERADQLGLECSLYYKSRPAAPGSEVAFLLRSFALAGRPRSDRPPATGRPD